MVVVYSVWLLYMTLLPLPLLSRFSHIQLCETPQMGAHQAPPSPGFSRQEHWSGLPFPSPVHECEKWKWSCSACPTLSDPMDCSLPGSSVHGIFQARVLEWGVIAFTHTWPYVCRNPQNCTTQRLNLKLYNFFLENLLRNQDILEWNKNFDKIIWMH